MPRKKKSETTAVSESDGATTAVAETTTASTARPSWVDGAPVTPDGKTIRGSFEAAGPQLADAAAAPREQKNWGNPYKSIFSCAEMGFELGEHKVFKQRVFRFTERPSQEVIDTLKQNGFTYRGEEKAWTVPASAQSRKLTDELARQWAGPNYIRGIDR